ncbi:MAG: PAS domain S-box protein [Dechloromonas sp.]|nr:MAG: PAS domain S-box protein [Dechloromonas sp.]
MRQAFPSAPPWLLKIRQPDLRGKITVALLAAALSIGGLTTLSAYLLARYQLTEHTHALLDARLQSERRELELRLSGIVELAASIAASSVTANALADSRGREIYLAPLLDNQRLLIPGATLTVVDYRGRTIASSTEDIPDYQNSTAFLQMNEGGAATAVLLHSNSGDSAVLAALPIIYRLTGNIEGAVMLHIPLSPLLGQASEDYYRWLVDRKGERLIGNPPSRAAIELGTALDLPTLLNAPGLKLQIARDQQVAYRPLDILLLIFGTIGLLVIIGIITFARLGARYITAPLGEIAEAAEEIAASGRPETRLPIRRDDEFGRLSAAFNTMVFRLRETYANLEELVAERTRDVEQSRLEAERASKLLHEAVQNIAVGFTIYDKNDRLVMCNEAYLRFYEDSRDLLVPGNSFTDIVRAGAERGQYAAAAGRVDEWVAERVALHQLADGTPIEQHLGDGRWLLIIEHRTPSGYIVGNRIDISELKASVSALAAREAYMRATLDNLPFFFWLKDTQSHFLAVNKMFANACGRTVPEEVVGLSDFDIWPRELAERYRTDDFAVMASRREKAVEEPVAGGTASGWIETYKKPVIAADGTLLGTVGFARDISERHLAEAKIRDTKEQLEAIFALSPDGFVSFDSAHRVKYASPAFTQLTGLSESDIIGLDEADFSRRLARECTATCCFPGVAALRKSQHGADGTTRGQRRQMMELSSAGKRVLEVGLRQSEAETVSQILYFRDITHETEVDRLKSEFLTTAAHELRTPMASIYGFSELMVHEEFPAEQQREFLSAIHSQSELMIAIINELLDLGRIEARRGKDFKLESIDLRDLLHHVVTSFKAPDNRPAPREPRLPAALLVRADRNKLTQAIGNVLSNAYKYSPQGGDVDLELVTTEDQTRIGIRITDHGIGMTPAQMSRVCERFYRADSSGKIPGTGLGMSIVKEIIELHGGRVLLDSEPGHGTTVTLWLPAAT